MSRSGYYDGEDNPGQLELYRSAVNRALRGKRGQQFLRELATAMDAMSEKILIAYELEDNGAFCALGVVGKKRGIQLAEVDPEDATGVAKLFNIAESMAREIVFINDDDFSRNDETPENRWLRVRRWVARQLGEPFSAATTKQEEVSSMDADRGGERSDGGAADEAHNGGER